MATAVAMSITTSATKKITTGRTLMPDEAGWPDAGADAVGPAMGLDASESLGRVLLAWSELSVRGSGI